MLYQRSSPGASVTPMEIITQVNNSVNSFAWGMFGLVLLIGLGSSVMVHSNFNVKEPVQQGMWGIFEVFADTMIVCTIDARCNQKTQVI